MIAAWRGQDQVHKNIWLDHLAKLMVIVGLGLSFYDFDGLKTLNQVLELGIAAGLLLGTYLLAKSKPQGYFWLMVGNISAASLMMRQSYYVLMVQQILSLSLVFDAYRVQRRKKKDNLYDSISENPNS